MIHPEQLRDLYQQACEIELQAFKPGNVSVYADGHDMTVADFRISAQVSAVPLCNPDYSLGEKIFYAVKATLEAVGCNTNLGIILLCAPMIQAVSQGFSGLTLRQVLSRVLAATTIEDAEWVFKAITLASPGGLGSSDEQDVTAKASVTLTEAMKIASSKDRIALQYITDYKDVFDFAVLRYNSCFDLWGAHNWAAVAVYTGLLSQFPDSHVERKYGERYSELVTTHMAMLDAALLETSEPEQIKPLLYRIDQAFKCQGINPGTTADLTVATVLAVFLEKLYR
jgi:triphosphoribosyl-dephospho-CoA synthase